MRRISTLNGFTLLEIIIVIMVITILATQAYLSLPVSSVNLGAQTDQLISDLRYTQSLSMTKGQRYRLVRSSSTAYQILNAAGTPIVLARGNTTMTLGTGISFGAFSNLPSNLVVFGGNGAPYIDTGSPGTLLSATASIVLNSGANTATILISPETGRVVQQ